MKAAPAESSSNPEQSSPDAVLCTDNQTYHVRQVQSSNSIFILHPSESRGAAQTDLVPLTALSAIAQCAVTLELVPSSLSTSTFLQQSIPIYSGPQQISGTLSQGTSTKVQILESAPFSSGELDKAWKDLCIFESEGRVWLPRAASLVTVWRSLISAAILRGMTFGDRFPVNTLEVILEEDGYPTGLLYALIHRLGSNNANPLDGCKLSFSWNMVC